jgi:hypothetical protein
MVVAKSVTPQLSRKSTRKAGMLYGVNRRMRDCTTDHSSMLSYRLVSIDSLLELWVCVRYRHCERDSVDVGDGASGVTRHPGLLHLLIRLRHGDQNTASSELDAVRDEGCQGATRCLECSSWPFGCGQSFRTSRHIVHFPSASYTPPTFTTIASML